MKINLSSPQKIGLLLSLIITLLVNSFQITIVLLGATPPNEGPGAFLLQLPSLGGDLLFNLSYCFIISWTLYEINRFIVERWQQWPFLIIRFIVSIAWSHLLTLLFVSLYTAIIDLPEYLIKDIRIHYHGQGGMISLMMLALSQILFLSRRNQQQKLEMERLIAENIRSQYIALKNQIDPHFLFNSLNTLNALIGIDSLRAQEYVQLLSSTFRYSMQDKESVSVRQEIQCAQTFARLMKIRYGEALSFDYDIDKEVLDLGILSFSLQILIENAVKHNVITPSKPLNVHIYTTRDKNMLCVENKINAKREPEPSEGIGLVNLARRYELLGGSSIEISQRNGIFSVSLPIIKQS